MKYQRDYYQVLGVKPDATQKEIRNAYRRLVILNHPDRNSSPQATARMQEINEAYDVIGDPNKRPQYDFEFLKATSETQTKSVSYPKTNIYRKSLPVWSGILGFISILCCCPLAFMYWQELGHFPGQPVHMTLSQAVAQIHHGSTMWVILDDIQWDCAHAFFDSNQREASTYIVFADKQNLVLGLAEFSGKVDCRSATQDAVPGVIGYPGDGAARFLNANGLDVAAHQQNGTFLFLCTYCGRDNTEFGAIFFAVPAGFGAILALRLLLSMWSLKREREYRARVSLGL